MRYKCIVKYDGTNFHGFQIQDNLRTVQKEIEGVLEIITKKETKIFSSGRTDAKVHAYGQVFHFDSDIIMKEWNMKNAINSRLPKDIYIQAVSLVDDEFHARYSAHTKVYKYVINTNEYDPFLKNYCYFFRHKLNINKMQEASKIFVGEHDFKAFTKNHKITNTTRTIYSIDFSFNKGILEIVFRGNGFLHNMIRIIIAMLIEVGNSRLEITDLQKILDSKNRLLAPKTAPAEGLYLVEVIY